MGTNSKKHIDNQAFDVPNLARVFKMYPKRIYLFQFMYTTDTQTEIMVLFLYSVPVAAIVYICFLLWDTRKQVCYCSSNTKAHLEPRWVQKWSNQMCSEFKVDSVFDKLWRYALWCGCYLLLSMFVRWYFTDSFTTMRKSCSSQSCCWLFYCLLFIYSS